MELYLIKKDDEKLIEIDENISKEIDDANGSFLDKYVNKENYSLVIYDDKKSKLITCINKNITKEESDKILSITRSFYEKKKIYSFTCYNYLENDYEVVNVSDRYKMDSCVVLFCEEKVGNDSYYIKNILRNFRTLNLRNCLLDNYTEKFPNNKNSGVILIEENSRRDISLTKRTHAELIDEYSKNNKDFDINSSIVVIVSGCSLFIEIPKIINDFQKDQLKKIDEEVSYIKNIHMPIYVDVLKDGILHDDISDALDIKVKKKDDSIH